MGHFAGITFQIAIWLSVRFVLLLARAWLELEILLKKFLSTFCVFFKKLFKHERVFVLNTFNSQKAVLVSI